MTQSKVEVSDVAATPERKERAVKEPVPSAPVVRSAAGARISSPSVPPSVLREKTMTDVAVRVTPVTASTPEEKVPVPY